MKAYLLFYNILSCALWIQILLLTVSYILTPHSTRPNPPSSSLFAPLMRFINLQSVLPHTSPTPKFVQTALDQLRGSYHFMGLGTWVKVTQTLAVMDVVHAALGLVKSNVGTAASQVFSRLWAVWAVVEMVPEVRLEVPYFPSVSLGSVEGSPALILLGVTVCIPGGSSSRFG